MIAAAAGERRECRAGGEYIGRKPDDRQGQQAPARAPKPLQGGQSGSSPPAGKFPIQVESTNSAAAQQP
jgi:hypothetical protein